ncbi:ABC transporter permease [Nocardiopsis potens]|uniref:ABC transporter permease n=1 Tax=Nocardiopsis potens TaxID=1246458 RepID=UPI0004755307|nr:FtsX-like permease family protein [Nocardiopsis potens]
MAGLRQHKTRLATTALAIALGVMFVTGTLVFSGTLKEAFSAQVMGAADKFAAVARPAAEQADPEKPAVLPEKTLEQVRGLDEVAEAGAVLRGDAPLLDKDGRAVGGMPTAGLGLEGETRYSADEGALPSAADEVALATTSADATGYRVGDRVTVLDAEGAEHEFTVSGLVDFGTDMELAYRGAVVFQADTARELTGAEGYAEIDATAAAGASDEAVADAVAAAAGSAAEVETGAAMGERLAEDAGTQATAFAVALMMFALVSVFVACIVIYNTFAILLAQRQREMALLRCVGAGRGQVFRGVLLEALVIGLLSSAIGVAAGIGLGWAGIHFGSQALGADGSGTTLVVGVLPVAVGLVVGMAMTLVAALVPAVRATRVPPLAALRTSATAQGMEKGIGWKRIAVGTLFFLVSAGLVTVALMAAPDPVSLVLSVVAGLVAFVGVVVLSPLIVRAVVAAVSPLMKRIGVPSMLAADNSRRSPKRAAAAMIALTVGATLITGYAVVNASLSKTMNHMLDEQFPVDYQIAAPMDGEEAAIPARVAEELRSSPAIGTAWEERLTYVESPDASGDMPVRTYIGAVVGEDVSDTVESGDLSDLGPGKVAVSKGYAGGRTAGDELTVATAEGERTYEIAAVTADMGTLWGATLAPEDFKAGFPGIKEPDTIGVRGADGASAAEVRDAVYDSVADDPLLRVDSTAEMRGQFDDMLELAFIAIAAMLGLAILIAVFGIANTMALSVLERTRESALLRALGLSRGQLRRMLSIEAVVLCLIGAGVGIGLGVLFGWAAASAILPNMVFGVPLGQIAVFVAVAVVAGLLASVLPGRRAAGTSISGALASE